MLISRRIIWVGVVALVRDPSCHPRVVRAAGSRLSACASAGMTSGGRGHPPRLTSVMRAEAGTRTSFSKVVGAVRSAGTALENALPVVVDPGLRRDDGEGRSLPCSLRKGAFGNKNLSPLSLRTS